MVFHRAPYAQILNFNLKNKCMTHENDSNYDERKERKNDLIKEISLIQSVINRMANSSSLIKGWTVTMITFIFAFKSDQQTLPLVFIPVLLFWLLDAYFLQRERMYRFLYEWVIQNRMTDDAHLFSLNTARFRSQRKPLIHVMFSLTLFIFYGGALILVSFYILFFYL
jgi:hypothetical protein